MNPNYKNKKIIFEICTLFALFYLPAYLFQSSIIDPEIFNNPFFNIRLWIIYIPQITLIFYLIHLDKEIKFIDFGITKPSLKDFPYIILTIIVLILIIVLVQIILMLIPSSTTVKDLFLWKINSIKIIPFILITSVLTGYSEELFFRSYLYTRFKQLQLGKGQILITVNLLFSLGHYYEGIEGCINAFILGLFFSFVFIWKKNLNIPAIVHALYNFSVLLLSYYINSN